MLDNLNLTYNIVTSQLQWIQCCVIIVVVKDECVVTDGTTITTIKLARAYNKIKSKLKPRARVLNNKEIFIKIDSKLKNKTDEQIYQAVFKALQRT